MAHMKNMCIRHYNCCYIIFYILLSPISVIFCKTPINTQDQARSFNNLYLSSAKANQIQGNEVSPYVDLALCTIRQEPWSCARQESARILEVWDGQLYSEWQTLKVEADRELNTTLARRGFSSSENISKEKPSTILKKIELGTNYMKEYLKNTMDGFLGYEYGNSEKGNDAEDAEEEEEDPKDDEYENDDVEDTNNAEENESEPDIVTNSMKHTAIIDTTTEDTEFIELNQTAQETVKNPLDDGTERKKMKKRKNNKKGQEPATIVVLQQPVSSSAHHGNHGGAGTEDVHLYQDEAQAHGSKPFKKKQHKRQKRRKNKHQHQHQLAESDDDAFSSALLGHNPTSSLGLGLLEDLLGDDDWLLDDSKRKKGHAANYGRSNGVTRGKKKKKKKALMKLVLLGSFLKAKIELLLKILGAHLQIKFFAIALIGLLINIARFWIDVKRGSSPQKVVYVENAHHQHHYEDHGEEWSEPGGYWKRSLPSVSTTDDNGSTDSYQPQQNDAHYMAYRNQWQ